MNCKGCNTEFEPKHRNAKFCNVLCKAKLHSKVYYHKHREKALRHKKEYYEANKKDIIAKTSKYCDDRRKIDIDYRVKRYLRSRLYNAVKRGYRSGSAIDNLGCTIIELREYLASKFTEGMSWDNYGKWHIDHIEPISKFNLADPNQLAKVCHYSNLQPLWAKPNISKGNR